MFELHKVTIDIDSKESVQLDSNHTHYLLVNDERSDPTRVKMAAHTHFLKTVAATRMEGSCKYI